MQFNCCKLHQNDALMFDIQYSIMQTGLCYAIHLFDYFLTASSNKTVWTGGKVISISSCILAQWYADKGVQFAWSVTRTGLHYAC